MSWFVLGVAFGIGCASSLTHNIDPSAWISAHNRVMPAFDNALSSAIESTRKVTQTMASSSAAVGKTLDDIVSSFGDDKAPAVVADAPQPPQAQAPQQLAQAQPVKSRPAKSYPLELDLKVQRGDTLISLLGDVGVSYDEAQAVVDSIRPVYNPRNLTAGQSISLHLNKEPDAAGNPVISQISIPISNTSTVEVKHSPDNAYDVRKVDVPVEQKLVRTGGTIDSSMYDTGVKSGLPPALLGEIINAYSYDVDFQRDIQPGDGIDVLFERKQTAEGDVTGYGNVLFAELTLNSRTLRIYRYADKQGNVDYYNEKGESLRKALLRTPINGAKITSKFGMRVHPLLGYSKMHRGIDFGAPIGTPIYAAGDGVVEFVGKKSGYGNYVAIKHNGTYSSAYGHISRFATGVSPGRKVKQGQIIAYVGMTGMATGPHLHYEIMVNHEQVNPSGVKFKTGNVLSGKELVAFRTNVSNINAKLASSERYKPLVMADASDSIKK